MGLTFGMGADPSRSWCVWTGECLHTKRMILYFRYFSISSFTDSLNLFINRLWSATENDLRAASNSSYVLNTRPFSILNIAGKEVRSESNTNFVTSHSYLCPFRPVPII